jgi:hypothetical protein
VRGYCAISFCWILAAELASWAFAPRQEAKTAATILDATIARKEFVTFSLDKNRWETAREGAKQPATACPSKRLTLTAPLAGSAQIICAERREPATVDPQDIKTVTDSALLQRCNTSFFLSLPLPGKLTTTQRHIARQWPDPEPQEAVSLPAFAMTYGAGNQFRLFVSPE